jgi:nucleoside-diphosphate-sugar epimerase
MKRILVTGGNGYVGSRIVTRLMDKGHYVTVTSRKRDQEWHPLLRIICLDASKDSIGEELLRDVDVVLHLISPSEKMCRDNPDLAHKIIVGGTHNLVNAAEKYGTPRIIYLSTVQVYGANLVGEIDEKTPVDPQNPYALYHLDAEEIVNSYSGASISVRLANSFGYPDNPEADCWSLVTNSLMKEVVINGTLTLKSSGLSHRNFIPMSDVVNCLEYLVNEINPSILHRVVNLGLQESRTILEMAQRVSSQFYLQTGKEVEIQTMPQDLNEVVSSFQMNLGMLSSLGIDIGGNLDSEISESLVKIRNWNT